MNWFSALAFFLCLLAGIPSLTHAAEDRCDICGRPFGASVFAPVDEMTGQKKRVCNECMFNSPACFLCGLPALPAGRTELPDGRVICARDSKDAILSEAEGERLCREVREALDRQLARFMSFPETNLTVSVVDRVTIQGLFKFAGKDYACPNVWGYLVTETNHGRREFSLNVLGGLPRALFRSTCAHELTHAWVHEHVSARRLAALDPNTHEGFCELIAHLLAAAENDRTALRGIEKNHYTRGQVQVLIATEQRFGLNDIVDWMKSGQDRALLADDLSRIRTLTPHDPPPNQPRAVAASPAAPMPEAPVPTNLVLRAISAGAGESWAQINNRSFRTGEQWPVRVGTSNVLVKCRAIHLDTVELELVETKEQRTLSLDLP